MAFHLAQANLSLLRHPPSAPRSAEYAAALDRVNHLADRALGFVWRQRLSLSEDERLVLNLSVWQAYPPLHEYTYRTAHGHFVRRRHEWFDQVPQPSTVLWWLPAGERPTAVEAMARLSHLRAHGPVPKAFSLRVRFTPEGTRERRR
ncbi:MAG: DUF3291 domain-containing protein [Actinophytocola sp.]|uniref:DUF3291 domain-containing protein n=1 Tax=Actinophytocola sp. TaxID=1872138 RepID=UPI003D6B07B1